MSRRLSEMTEQSLLGGGRSTRRNLEHIGFSEELKKQLEERIITSSFKSEYAAAHSIVNMPSSAGQGTRDTAAATAWTGTESLHDSALRMLNDSSKPLRAPYKIPQPPTLPVKFQLSPKPPKSPGLRIARAKEKTSVYTQSQNSGISEEERNALRREMQDRFTPGFRAMPMSIQGLASLANERIEDAIASGHFKGIPRGKGVNVEADHNANNAFIDTTEYLMNKMIKRQDIMPPWIEKQQELSREVERFRQRLRSDWRRHAARLIASKGGSLETQMRRARGHAAAEARLAERAKTEASFQGDSDMVAEPQSATQLNDEDRLVHGPQETQSEMQSASDSIPYLPPLRDPDYISTERSYHELAIKELNSLTRSYNLQAPQVAQKPYLSLDRELASCYADVAPSLADEIKRRATERARSPVSTIQPRSPGLLNTFGMAGTARVYDEDKSKSYGFKEFWRDLFSRKDDSQAR